MYMQYISISKYIHIHAVYKYTYTQYYMYMNGHSTIRV